MDHTLRRGRRHGVVDKAIVTRECVLTWAQYFGSLRFQAMASAVLTRLKWSRQNSSFFLKFCAEFRVLLLKLRSCHLFIGSGEIGA